MKLRRWESWIIINVNGKTSEKRLRKHLTRKGAESWAKSIAYSPEILLGIVEGMARGIVSDVQPEVRRID